MRVADLRPGWRTDFTLHAAAAEVSERDDALAAWLTADFEPHVNAVMRLRPIVWSGPGAEVEAVVDLQCVDTHGFEPLGYCACRRRGLCSALVHPVGRHALQAWQADEVVMVADPDDVAMGICRGLGHAEFEREWCLERRAPEDRAA